MGFTMLDTVVMAAYFALMIIVSLKYMRRAESADGFFNGSASFGKFALMCTVCATMMGGGGLIGRGGVAYTRGIDSLVLGLPYPIGVLIFARMAGHIQQIGAKHQIASIPELMEKRFGKNVKLVTALILTVAMACVIGISVAATATILSIVGGNLGISFEMGAIISTIVFVVYTCTSGLFGVVMTDIMQFFIMMIFVFITLPAVATIGQGGLPELLSKIEPSMFVPNVDGYLVGTFVTNILSVFCGAELWQRAFCAKDKPAATKGMAYGAICFIFTSFVVFYLGAAGSVVFPSLGTTGNPDECIPLMAIQLLPAGISGLCIAGMAAVTMSSADSYLLMSARSFTEDFVKTLKPDITEAQRIRLTRAIMPVLGIFALAVALWIPGVYNIAIQVYSYFNGCMAIPCLMALYWKGATGTGILAGIFGSFATCLLWNFLGSPLGLGVTIPACVVGLPTIIIVSRLTWKKSPSQFLE